MNLRAVMLLCALFTSHAVFAQTAQDTPAVEPSDGIDDVVIVNGVRHPVQLRLQMLDAELKVYDLFNQLNDEPQFEIECARHNVIGTRLQAQFCQPLFERQALTLEAQDYLAAYRSFLDPLNFDYSPNSMAGPSATIIRPQQRRLQHEMKAMAEEHPEFTEALISYVNFKARYRQATRRVDE